MARARNRIRELVNRRRSCVPLPIMVGQVNRYLRGWAQYFDYGYPRTASRALNKFVYERFRRHLQHHRSQRAYRPPAASGSCIQGNFLPRTAQGAGSWLNSILRLARSIS